MRDRVGFAYRYNVANVDPQPWTRRINKRFEELQEDFSKEDYLKILRYVAELELKFELFASKGGEVPSEKSNVENQVIISAGGYNKMAMKTIFICDKCHTEDDVKSVDDWLFPACTTLCFKFQRAEGLKPIHVCKVCAEFLLKEAVKKFVNTH